MTGGSVGNALTFLVDTLFSLYLVAFLLRLCLEAVRADFYNPISQLLVRATDPLVRPVARVLPRLGTINSAGLLVLYLVQVLALYANAMINGILPDPVSVAFIAVLRLVRMLLVLYLILIIIGVILSWVGHGVRHPIVPLIYQLVEPVLRPIRRIIPAVAGLDLSPLVAIIAIQFLIILLGI